MGLGLVCDEAIPKIFRVGVVGWDYSLIMIFGNSTAQFKLKLLWDYFGPVAMHGHDPSG